MENHGNLALDLENCEIMSYVALEQAKKVLLEEDIDENINANLEESALKAVEKSFYDILETNYSPSPNNTSQSNLSQANPRNTENFPGSINDIKTHNLSMLEFKRGMQEGMKFLPNFNHNNFVVDLTDDDFDIRKFGEGENKNTDCVRFKGKRRADCGELSHFEGPKCKISMLYFKDPARDEMFNKVLFLHGDDFSKEVTHLRGLMRNQMKIYKQNKLNEDTTDLRTLLIHCSQAIAINNTQRAEELINQIKNHSSPHGNGSQRMANIFIKGLEARLYGMSTKFYKKRVSFVSMVDILKAYHLYLIASPFTKACDYFANVTIFNAIGNASKLHIIHFGIDFGLQWSCLIKGLSQRKEGPPKLRITGIDICNERIEEAGRRLYDYTRWFNVPFEYKGIGTKWDKICIEDLNIEKDEVIFVNCLRGLESLGDEPDVMYSPKNQVLDIIRRIKPRVFIQGIVNGSFDDALFVTRFRHALLHYSAMFDSLDATIPRENNQRMFIENDLWASDVFNVIACEGLDRVERPETYKQWHARNLRAGFEQLPLDYTIINELNYKLVDVYNKGFLVEDDNNWVLLGWKGRIIHALSTWRPKQV